MPNRLAKESSPYLLQHKDNPVDWYPWGEEAFAKARAEDKPIFLSVGYSSCHWCHVMEHESFEDAGVADALNRDFVSVKVDREERPDVDEAYMTAVQLSSGRGGWPMSVFMTPDRKPFLAATYFPKDDRQGQPGFLTILRSVAKAWKDTRDGLVKAADEFATALEETSKREAPPSSAQLNEALLERAVAVLSQDFDQANGGFGDKPKFPPHTALELLMASAIRAKSSAQMRELAVAMSLITLEKMCLGGIHDHVGGGFHRYSTDERWLLPHFEKMLYDNALMLGNLAWGARIAMQLDQRLASLFTRSAERLVGWLEREMRSPEGLFYSALDADSDGEEGKFYMWAEDGVRKALGDRADAFCKAYGVRPEGNFRDEATGKLTAANVLHLAEDDGGAFEGELDRLLTSRSVAAQSSTINNQPSALSPPPSPSPLAGTSHPESGEGVPISPPPAPFPRTQPRGEGVPGLDYKALVGWNGLMILALAEAGAMPFAEAAADAILKVEAGTGSLPRQVIPPLSPDGELGTPSPFSGWLVPANGEGAGGGEAAWEGFLDDYAYFTLALLKLAEATDATGKREVDQGSPYYLPAVRLCKAMVERFYDEANAGFFYTSDRHERLFGRTKPVFDQPIPSATSVAVRCLIRLGDLDRARKTIESCMGWMERAPGSTEGLLLAAMELLDATTAGDVSLPAAGTIQPASSDASLDDEPSVVEAPAPHRREVAVSLSSRELRAAPDGWASSEIVLDIPDGLHINTNDPPARWLTPTTVDIEGVESECDYPEGKDFRYEGQTAIPFKLRLPAGKSGAEFELRVRFQACTESECLAPVEKVFDGVILASD